MTRRSLLLAALLLAPSALRAELPACPLIFMVGGSDPGSWSTGRAPCRLGQFKFADFMFDNDSGFWGHGWIHEIRMGVFADHLTFDFPSIDPRLDYVLDPTNPFQTFDWLREIFAVNIIPNDGTHLTDSNLYSPMEAIFDVPPGGSAFASISGGLGGWNPYGGYWNFSTVFWAVTTVDPLISTAPLTASIINPSWSIDVFFTTDVSVVPEPSTWVLMGTGFGLLGLVGWRRRRRIRPT